MAKINVANPHDRAFYDNSYLFYLFYFGAYGLTVVLAYANSLEDALEEAAKWLADNAPGIFVEVDYAEACTEAGLSWPPESEEFHVAHEDEYLAAYERAETDLIYTEAGYIASWEWAVEENPIKARLIQIARGR